MCVRCVYNYIMDFPTNFPPIDDTMEFDKYHLLVCSAIELGVVFL